MHNFLSAVFELRPTYQRDANKKRYQFALPTERLQLLNVADIAC